MAILSGFHVKFNFLLPLTANPAPPACYRKLAEPTLLLLTMILSLKFFPIPLYRLAATAVSWEARNRDLAPSWRGRTGCGYPLCVWVLLYEQKVSLLLFCKMAKVKTPALEVTWEHPFAHASQGRKPKSLLISGNLLRVRKKCQTSGKIKHKTWGALEI